MQIVTRQEAQEAVDVANAQGGFFRSDEQPVYPFGRTDICALVRYGENVDKLFLVWKDEEGKMKRVEVVNYLIDTVGALDIDDVEMFKEGKIARITVRLKGSTGFLSRVGAHIFGLQD